MDREFGRELHLDLELLDEAARGEFRRDGLDPDRLETEELHDCRVEGLEDCLLHRKELEKSFLVGCPVLVGYVLEFSTKGNQIADFVDGSSLFHVDAHGSHVVGQSNERDSPFFGVSDGPHESVRPKGPAVIGSEDLGAH